MSTNSTSIQTASALPVLAAHAPRLAIDDGPPRCPTEWRGAAPTSAPTHLAIQEAQDGKAADWFEPVGDQDYDTPS